VLLCDASPLIALLDKTDPAHERCVAVLPLLTPPLITTWPCFTEAMYFLGKFGGWSAQQKLWQLVEQQILILRLPEESESMRMAELMAQYADLPMDLADATLVTAAETLQQQRIFTLDSDFRVYRLPGNQTFKVIPGE
jgi:uncharacterized protein